MRKTTLAALGTPAVAALALAVWFALPRTAVSHCEIPCGIYGDRTRIDLLFEDIATVEKSMQQIIALTEKSEKAPVDVNQIVRWVRNKEEHAQKIQHIVTQYFMTQRVKQKAEGDPQRERYIRQLTSLHSLLVTAMRAKQTTDLEIPKALRKLVHEFSASYFSAEDLRHIREHHGGK